MKENRNKKIVCTCLIAFMSLAVLTGCSTDEMPASEIVSEAPTGKVVVNFEGVVTAVNGDEVTLENGKIVVISSDTVFAGDTDIGNGVSEEILVGNFIQGYTKDNTENEKVSAGKIYCNAAAQPGGGKLVINFEGKVASVEENSVTLENGQVILITDDTVFSIPSGVVENVILSEGYRIQGYAEDETAASRIHIMGY